MTNSIVILILLAIVTGAIVTIVRAKQKGVKCVGCPYSQRNDSRCSCKDVR